MTPIDIILIILLVGIAGLVVWQATCLARLNKPQSPDLSAAAQAGQSMLMLQQQVQALKDQVNNSLKDSFQLINQWNSDLRQVIDQKLHQNIEAIQLSHKTMGERLDHTAQVVGAVQGQLGELGQASARILEVGKDIASLQDILRAPKLRGGLGEIFLNDLLAQMLPQANYQLQYEFSSKQKVDAVIKLGSHLVPVDAKFPLENFRKMLEAPESEKAGCRNDFRTNVKKHIDDIAGKYILPDEGTYDFALMYIPAENVYYEIILRNEGDTREALNEYALKNRVIPVSPNSFYAYLQAIAYGLRGLRVEGRAREILDHLLKLRSDFNKFRAEFEAMGGSLTASQKHFSQAERNLNKVDARFSALEAPSTDPALLGVQDKVAVNPK